MLSASKPPPGGGRGHKRKWIDWKLLDSDAFTGNTVRSEGFYFIAERINNEGEEKKNFSSINKMLADKFLRSKFPSGFTFVTNLKRDGTTLFKANSQSEASKAVGEHLMDQTLNIKVKISIHKSLNICKGTFYSEDLSEDKVEDMFEELKRKNKTAVRFERMKKYEKGVEAGYLNRYLAEFEATSLPEFVSFGYMRFRLQRFYDNPIRCNKCQKYGHTKNHCTGELICRTCSLAIPHEPADNCGPTKCANCGGPHPANDIDCAERQKEVYIKRLQVDKRISHYQARREFQRMNQNPVFCEKFAQVVGATPTVKPTQNQEAPPQMVEMFNKMMVELGKLQQQNKELHDKMANMQEEMNALRLENQKLKAKLDKAEISDFSEDDFSMAQQNQIELNLATNSDEDMETDASVKINKKLKLIEKNPKPSRATRSGGIKKMKTMITQENKKLLPKSQQKLFEEMVKRSGDDYTCAYDITEQKLLTDSSVWSQYVDIED